MCAITPFLRARPLLPQSVSAPFALSCRPRARPHTHTHTHTHTSGAQIEELGGGETEEGRALKDKLKWSAVLHRAQGVKASYPSRTRTVDRVGLGQLYESDVDGIRVERRAAPHPGRQGELSESDADSYPSRTRTAIRVGCGRGPSGAPCCTAPRASRRVRIRVGRGQIPRPDSDEIRAGPGSGRGPPVGFFDHLTIF